jgi:hypothetical protein
MGVLLAMTHYIGASTGMPNTKETAYPAREERPESAKRECPLEERNQ